MARVALTGAFDEMMATMPTDRPHAASRLVRLLTACGLLLAAIATAGETRHVLVLYSSHRLLPANLEAEGALRETIANSTELSAEFLDYPRFEGESYVRTVTAFLREKYALRPPEVLVVGGEEALAFLLDHRAQIFPTVPVVHTVIFLTGYADMAASVRAMKAGAVDFLTKPVERAALFDALQRAARDEAEQLRARFASLTPRERAVFEGIVAGQLNKRIGEELEIAERTVKLQRAQLMAKLGAGSVAELGALAERLQHLSE